MAQDAIVGTLQAVGNVGGAGGSAIRDSIIGVIQGVGMVGTAATTMLHDVVVGAIRGSSDAGAELATATRQAVEGAFSHAVALASALDIPLPLLRVSHTTDFYRSLLARTAPAAVRGAAPGRMFAEALARADADEVDAHLDAVQDRLAGDGNDLAVTASHRQDDNVAQAIIDQAESQQSVVVMSTHGRGGISRVVWAA